jgi:hypothetical protein
MSAMQQEKSTISKSIQMSEGAGLQTKALQTTVKKEAGVEASSVQSCAFKCIQCQHRSTIFNHAAGEVEKIEMSSDE